MNSEMANKETIEQLKWVKKRICDITYSPESFEALDFAIKAIRIVEVIEDGFKRDGNMMDSDDWEDIKIFVENGTPLSKGHGRIEADKEPSLEEVINKPSKDPIGFNIDDLDSLEETAELIFKNKVGTAELFVGGKDYLVLQHDLNKPVSEQVYDVYSVQETLGMKVPFDDMVQKIKDDIIQSIQMGR